MATFKDMIMTKEKISELKVPLQELCMIGYGGKSFGPIWVQDVRDIGSDLSPFRNELRWRKFGTEQWGPISDLIGEEIELSTNQEDDLEMLTMAQNEHVLPTAPTREQLAWGREQVMQHISLDEEHEMLKKSEALAKLIVFSKKGINSKNQEKAPVESVPVTTTPLQSANVSRSASLVAFSAVVGLALIIGLRVGIDRLPKSFFDFPGTSGSSVAESDTQENGQRIGHQSKNMINGNIAPSNTRAPASGTAISSNPRKRRPNSRTRRTQDAQDNGDPNFRDSEAYERQHIGPEGLGYNDQTGKTENDFQVDDGQGPIEQDPLRRKLGRETVNPEEEDTVQEERSPASEEEPQPEVQEEAQPDLSE